MLLFLDSDSSHVHFFWCTFAGEIVLFNIFYEFFTVCTSVVAEDPSGKHVAGCGSLTELVIFVHVSYLSTHTVYWYNIHFFSLWGVGGYGHIGKWIQGNVIFMLSWCLMSSDVIWHIRDKLWPMPKHGSIKATYVRCMRVLAVTCHLHFLAEWPGFFMCYCGNTGVERILK